MIAETQKDRLCSAGSREILPLPSRTQGLTTTTRPVAAPCPQLSTDTHRETDSGGCQLPSGQEAHSLHMLLPRPKQESRTECS